jgi:tRNA (guanosine-2'-O-)-methyltransferase
MSEIDPKYSRTLRRVEKLKKVLRARQTDLTAVFENINDPHNLSACLRSCDSVGIYEVNTIYHGKQTPPNLGNYTSASAKKWVKLNNYTSVEECFYNLKETGFNIYTTHLAVDSISLYDLDLTKPTALVFGNEHEGISDTALELADANFIIPQVGMIQSLNISVATAVSLYEVFRQRKIAGKYDKQSLSNEDFEKILEMWTKK